MQRKTKILIGIIIAVFIVAACTVLFFCNCYKQWTKTDFNDIKQEFFSNRVMFEDVKDVLLSFNVDKQILYEDIESSELSDEIKEKLKYIMGNLHFAAIYTENCANDDKCIVFYCDANQQPQEGYGVIYTQNGLGNIHVPYNEEIDEGWYFYATEYI